MASSGYELVWVKYKRAEQHIKDFYSEQAQFFRGGQNPYEIKTKRDPQTRELIYYLGNIKPVPLHFSAIIGDAVHNLRATLDIPACPSWRGEG